MRILLIFLLSLTACVQTSIGTHTAYAGGQWLVTCETDDFDDTHSCKIQKGGLAVILLSEGSKLITFGFDHHPGTSLDVRIDRNKGLSWKENEFPQAVFDEAIRQMRSGKVIKMRYRQWPNYKEYTGSVSLDGFVEAHDNALSRIEALKAYSEGRS